MKLDSGTIMTDPLVNHQAENVMVQITAANILYKALPALSLFLEEKILFCMKLDSDTTMTDHLANH